MLVHVGYNTTHKYNNAGLQYIHQGCWFVSTTKLDTSSDFPWEVPGISLFIPVRYLEGTRKTNHH